MSWKRTHNCGELDLQHTDETVILNGWVDVRRDLGGIIFIDLRDRYGITQVVFDQKNKELHAQADQLRSEYVIGVKGSVTERDNENINPDRETGRIEVRAVDLVIYSKAETPPFEIKDDIETGEEIRLRYRYLDLRRKKLQDNLLLRSKVAHTIRNFYHEKDFAEVETPMLMRSTPEGARDYLVPSRVNPGKFFALPQSPQTYKQILMVSGFDRYYQIVKCFRDEDLRADRQPEFTQLDVEMSFVDEEAVFAIHEKLMVRIWKEHMGIDLPIPFPRMSYKEAMESYGSDKPDTRIEMKIADLSGIVGKSGFKIFSKTVDDGGKVVAITVPGQGAMGRGALDRLTDEVKSQIGAAGLIYIKSESGKRNCSVGKFLEEDTVEEMAQKAGAGSDDLVLILAGSVPRVYQQMGILRLMMGKRYNLINTEKDHFLWITEFPLVTWDDESARFHALHHPFTAPVDVDIDKMESTPEVVKARAYDLVLNGNELGGGSIRIHEPGLQRKMFRLLGIGEEEAQEKFGYLLDAFKFGAPPHGGIAFGLDRLIMLMAGARSLRDVIAFPKNQRAQSPMDNCPDRVDQSQLDELHIRLKQSIENSV